MKDSIMHIIIHTSTLLTDYQIARLRNAVRAQLDDGKGVVVLPPGCTMEIRASAPTDADVVSATSAIVAEAVSRYEARMKELGYEAKADIPPASIRLERRCWPERFRLSYKGWRKDMGVLDALRAAWRISR